MSAPHLPPKSCSIKVHEQFRLLPWTVFLIIVSALTSVAVSLSVVTWFLPNVIPQVQVTPRGARAPEAIFVDPALDRQIKQSVFRVYDTRKKVDGAYYADDALLGQAAILSSDGWAVLSGKGAALRASFLEAVDHQGAVYPVERIIPDSLAGLTYIKVKGSGFRVMALFPWDSVPEESLWSVLPDGYREVFLGEAEKNEGAEDVFAISEPQYAFEFLPAVSAVSMILTTRGELAGFAGLDGRLVPSWMVGNQLPSILSASRVSYLGLPYRGRFLSSIVSETGFSPLPGFYVEQSPTKATSSTIGKKDVMVKILGKPVDKIDLARQVLTAPDPVSVTVFRDGQEYDILVPKTEVGK